LNIFSGTSSVETMQYIRVRAFLGVTAAVFLACSQASPVDSQTSWPEFRGPTGQGVSTARHLPLQWINSPEAKNILWKTAIPGQAWSSPVLQNQRLYLTTALASADQPGLSLRALCLDASAGTIVWDVEVVAVPEKGRIHSKNSYASPTPIIEGDRLYVHFGHQGTACLDLKGKVLWRNTSLNYPPVHGSGGSPILVDDALIFSCDGASDPFVVALEKKTGDVRWKVARNIEASKKFSFTTPLCITVNGQKQVISPASAAVCAYDPQNGRELWRVRYAEGYSVVPRPVYGHGLVFISTSFDRPEVMAIRPDGQGDVTATHVAWTLRKGAPNTPSLLLVDDELYLVSDAGIASCVDAKTGKVNWSERVGGNYSASPLYADGRIYLQNEEGVGVVVKPGKTFQELARNSLNERTLASYAVADGTLFIRGQEHLFCVVGEKLSSALPASP
jgi:outer membrane protein assembly factor BamB